MPDNPTTDESLTPEAWEAWQATNRRLLAEGYELSTKVCFDGSVEWWATRGDEKFRRDPGWKGTPVSNDTTDLHTKLVDVIGPLLAPTSGLSAGLVGRATKKKARAIADAVLSLIREDEPPPNRPGPGWVIDRPIKTLEQALKGINKEINDA